MASEKPWRDNIYLVVIATQLCGMLVLDLVDFYPQALYTSPSSPLHFLTTLRSTYISTTGDPFFANAPPPWLHGFLIVEGLVQLPLAAFLTSRLVRSRPGVAAELAALAFGCLTAMGSVACCAELAVMGVDVVSEERRVRLLYATYLPFVVIPAVMAVDMYCRLLGRLQSGTTAKPKTQ